MSSSIRFYAYLSGPERLCDYEELEQCFQFYRESLSLSLSEVEDFTRALVFVVPKQDPISFAGNATTKRYSSDCQCQRPCDTVQYDTSISYAGFMSDFMYNYFLTKGIFPTPEYGRQGGHSEPIFF